MKFAAGSLRALGRHAGSSSSHAHAHAHALVFPRGIMQRVGVSLLHMHMHSSVQLPATTGRVTVLLARRSMTSAYSGEAGDGTFGLDKLSSYVPFQTIVNGRNVEIGPFQASPVQHNICVWIPGPGRICVVCG
jgi:hypothetical protein